MQQCFPFFFPLNIVKTQTSLRCNYKAQQPNTITASQSFKFDHLPVQSTTPRKHCTPSRVAAAFLIHYVEFPF